MFFAQTQPARWSPQLTSEPLAHLSHLRTTSGVPSAGGSLAASRPTSAHRPKAPPGAPGTIEQDLEASMSAGLLR
jgi:hypothetical protein